MIKARQKTIEIDRGFKEFRRQLRLAKRQPFVKIGVQADAGQHGESGVSLALIASANEFGTRDGRIPERSFIRSTMAEDRRKFVRKTEKLLLRVFSGKMTAVRVLNIMGITITSAIKRKITTLDKPPNAPSTIARKGSDNPLIDTGQLRASIRHEVVRNGTRE